MLLTWSCPGLGYSGSGPELVLVLDLLVNLVLNTDVVVVLDLVRVLILDPVLDLDRFLILDLVIDPVLILVSEGAVAVL